jgi:L-alanine-DL-glutamate epimerase-like enolase superfamily enzyme
MQGMKIRYWTYELKFRHPFTISKGTKTHQPTLVVELEHFGIKAYGEAPAITYYGVTTDQMAKALESKKKVLESFAFTDPERYWHFLHHLLPENAFLVCALDIAGWDLYGKLKKKPVYACWGSKFENTPDTDYTIGIDETDKMLVKMKEMPWPVYKIKLGTPNDIEIMEKIRKHTDARLRVDANGGWTAAEAMEKIRALRDLNVELIEQPLAKGDWEGMELISKDTPVPLFADESCVKEEDVEKCGRYFQGINIKLTKCGGITPARRMIGNARKLGLQVMMGSMNESTIGSAAIAQFLPQLDFVDMDGPLLLEEDLAKGLNFSDGRVTLSGQPGLGIEFSRT